MVKDHLNPSSINSLDMGGFRHPIKTSFNKYIMIDSSFLEISTQIMFWHYLHPAISKESRVLTRYHLELYPGKVVAIIEPRIRGVMIESQNLLITTSEPLIMCQPLKLI